MQQQQAPAPPSSSAATSIAQLPLALIVRTLQLVPQHHRLSSCALVSSTLHAAAAQATTHITCTLGDPTHAAACEAWLEKHGRQVEALAVQHGVGGRQNTAKLALRLPWAHLSALQDLILTRINLPANSDSGISDSHEGSSSAAQPSSEQLPHLKRLQLDDCSIPSADCLAHLISSPGLTRLVIQGGSHDRSSFEQLVSTALCSLQRPPPLVVLQLRPFGLTQGAIRQVVGMHNVQDLELWIAEDAGGGLPADIPSSLTRLVVLDRREISNAVEPTLSPQVQLPSLQELNLEYGSLSPAVLGTQLTRLQLYGCTLAPDEPVSTADFLGALQQLTLLQHLHLHDLGLASGAPRTPQQWSALTASTALTYLWLSEENSQPLPVDVVAQHMFAAGKQLPQLQVLAIEQLWNSHHERCLGGQDLQRVISSCPSLVQLNVAHTVREAADMSGMRELPASCIHLQIGGTGLTDAPGVLAHVPQLSKLVWEEARDLTDLQLQQLVALQGLTALSIQNCQGISMGIVTAACGSFNPEWDEPLIELESSDQKVGDKESKWEGAACLEAMGFAS